MRIGAVAAAAQVGEDTLRYYERLGLLEAPMRAPNGYREYSEEAVTIVRFIKRAQELGFTLEDARQLLLLRNAPAKNRLKARELVSAKMADVERKLVDLQALHRALHQLIDDCCHTASNRCPILEALDGSATVRDRHPGHTRNLKGNAS